MKIASLIDQRFELRTHAPFKTAIIFPILPNLEAVAASRKSNAVGVDHAVYPSPSDESVLVDVFNPKTRPNHHQYVNPSDYRPSRDGDRERLAKSLIAAAAAAGFPLVKSATKNGDRTLACPCHRHHSTKLPIDDSSTAAPVLPIFFKQNVKPERLVNRSGNKKSSEKASSKTPAVLSKKPSTSKKSSSRRPGATQSTCKAKVTDSHCTSLPYHNQSLPLFSCFYISHTDNNQS